MDYHRALDTSPELYGKRQTEWVNPTTLDRNIFLHGQEVISTSPFANCCVFTSDTPAVSSVTVSPSSAVVYQGQELKLSASVVTTGFANKAVTWSVVDSTTLEPVDGVTINESGVLKVASTVANNVELTVTAKSVFDTTKSATATISTPIVAS